jgi:hypothetical protein
VTHGSRVGVCRGSAVTGSVVVDSPSRGLTRWTRTVGGEVEVEAAMIKEGVR